MLCTAAGLRHRIEVTAHPVNDDWRFPELPEEHFQFSASELAQAIEDIRLWQQVKQPRKPEQDWENELDDGLTRGERDALYARQAS